VNVLEITVTRRDLVEPMTLIGQQAREHVDAPRRALRVRLAAELRGELELFDEGDQIRAVSLEHRTVTRQIDLAHDEVLKSLLDAVVAPWQKAATEPVRNVAEMQIDACGLDRRLWQQGAIPGDQPRADGLVEPLRR
jgi:hypothetical protein